MMEGTNPGKVPVMPIYEGDLVSVGLTKREYFAAIALQGLLSNPVIVEIGQYGDDDDLVFETKGIEALAVERADALIAELNKA